MGGGGDDAPAFPARRAELGGQGAHTLARRLRRGKGIGGPSPSPKVPSGASGCRPHG
eukprot:NODE_19878_length_206_cov_74.119205.p4 GENE.NODE_19878_length_206_cov_74.119205~~NODE_19878_length_206_cov_74.119205.p4  ORF type:complete len:57 (+),score=4.24 NODE_19878_length_206_cov_74.119205:3-173(+)